MVFVLFLILTFCQGCYSHSSYKQTGQRPPTMEPYSTPEIPPNPPKARLEFKVFKVREKSQYPYPFSIEAYEETVLKAQKDLSTEKE